MLHVPGQAIYPVATAGFLLSCSTFFFSWEGFLFPFKVTQPENRAPILFFPLAGLLCGCFIHQGKPFHQAVHILVTNFDPRTNMGSQPFFDTYFGYASFTRASHCGFTHF